MLERLENLDFRRWALDAFSSNWLDLNVTNLENLSILKNPDPAIIIFNHTNHADQFVASGVVARALANVSRSRYRLIIPVSRGYAEVNREYKIGMSFFGKVGGAELWGVGQGYENRIVEEDDNIDRKDDHKVKKNNNPSIGNDPLLIKKMAGAILSEGSITEFAPEGHRSPSCSLGPAERSLGFLVAEIITNNINAHIVPLAIIPRSRPVQRGFPPVPKSRHLDVVVGVPLDKNMIYTATKKLCSNFGVQFYDGDDKRKFIAENSELLTHVVMLQLRDMLLKDMWGVYNPNVPDQFKSVLCGEIKYAKRMSDDEVVLAKRIRYHRWVEYHQV